LLTCFVFVQLYIYIFGLTWTLLSLQITGETVGEVKAVSDMHQRKAEMARHSDAFIALPGWYYNTEYNFLFLFFSHTLLYNFINLTYIVLIEHTHSIIIFMAE
jgi:hypothetical protein